MTASFLPPPNTPFGHPLRSLWPLDLGIHFLNHGSFGAAPRHVLAALAVALAAPSSSSGQASGDEAALTALINEVAAQQAILADNQTQIDTKLAAVAENIRLARIYAGRSR